MDNDIYVHNPYVGLQMCVRVIQSRFVHDRFTSLSLSGYQLEYSEVDVVLHYDLPDSRQWKKRVWLRKSYPKKLFRWNTTEVDGCSGCVDNLPLPCIWLLVIGEAYYTMLTLLSLFSLSLSLSLSLTHTYTHTHTLESPFLPTLSSISSPPSCRKFSAI